MHTTLSPRRADRSSLVDVRRLEFPGRHLPLEQDIELVEGAIFGFREPEVRPDQA